MVVSLWPHFLAQSCTSAVKWRVSAMYDGAVPIHYLVEHYSQQNKPLGKLYCWVCQWFFKSANIWQRYKHSSKNMIVSCTFFVFQQCIDQARKVHETTTLLLVTLPSIHRFKKIFFARRLRNTHGEVTLQSPWSRYDRHFVGRPIARYNAFS